MPVAATPFEEGAAVRYILLGRIDLTLLAVAGDTVYFRAGKYAYTSGLTTCKSGTDTVNAILLNAGGKSGAPIKYWAYPGETPVFDFSGIKDEKERADLIAWLRMQSDNPLPWPAIK